MPRSSQGEFELSSMTHVMSADGDSLLAPHLRSTGGRNYGKFNDPVLDGLIDKQRAAVTQEERRKLAQEAEMRILDQVPMIFTYNPYYLLIAQPYVHNAGDGPVAGSGGYMVERAWVEKR